MFEQVILDNSEQGIAKLWQKSFKANKEPLTGIERISNKSVQYVIRDCALVTSLYLPIFIYGEYTDPIKQLSGKFTKTEIKNFVNECDKNHSKQHLLAVILGDIVETPLKLDESVISKQSLDDVYGDYMELQTTPDNVTSQEKIVTMKSSKEEIIEYLIDVFKVTKEK